MKRYFWGLVLIALGLLALLQSMGLENFGLSFWPVVLTLFGLSIAFESFTSYRGTWFGLALGLWLGAIGLFEILNNAGITLEDGGTVAAIGWPILLIAIGLSVFFGKRIGLNIDIHRHKRDWTRSGPGQHQFVGDLRYGRSPWVLDGDLQLSNSVGDLKLDLTTADITPGTHTIEVSQFVGETVIKVPDNVTVRVTAEASVGELEILGDHRSGASLFLQREVVIPDCPVELVIKAYQRVGSLRVVRLPVPTMRVIE